MKQKSRAALALAVALIASAVAQLPPDPGSFYSAHQFDLSDLPHYAPTQKVSGVIRIWGSGYIAAGRTLRDWQIGFRKFHPGVTIEAHLGDSLTAVPSLYAGAADLGSGPRISWNDLKAFNHTRGYDPLAIMVMSGSYNVPGWNAAFAILVHKDNPLSQLTLSQLDGIFGGARDGGWRGIVWHPELARGKDRDLRTWGQVGLKGEWAARPIQVYGANGRYGVSLTMSDALLAGSDHWNESIHQFTNRKVPVDSAHPDGTLLALEQIVEAIRQDPCGIGFASIAFLTPQTKVLALSSGEGGPFVPLTLATVENRSYPLADESYFYLDRPPGRPVDPKLKEFLRYLLSREGQEVVTKDGKYLPLTPELARAQLAKLE